MSHKRAELALYEEYKTTAVACFKEYATKLVTSARPRLEPMPAQRLAAWLKQFDEQPPEELNFDPKSPHLRYDLLMGLLGGGVWRCDYIREQIFYDARSLWSEFPPLKDAIEDIRRHMKVPLGRGTIGYVVQNGTSFPGGFYLIEDAEADLRGAVALDDRRLGEINVICYPIRTAETECVEGVFCMFLPIAAMFDREFAITFTQAVQPIGEKLLHLWETDRYRSVLASIHNNYLSLHSDAAQTALPLRDRVHALAESIGWSKDRAAQEDGDADPRFAWVGVLDCGPTVTWRGGAETLTGEPGGEPADSGSGVAITHTKTSLVTSWVESESFMRAKQLGVIDRCVLPEGFEPQRVGWPSGRKDLHFNRCAWSECIRDLVIPLPNTIPGTVGKLEGEVRIHCSRPSGCGSEELNEALPQQVEAIKAARELGVILARFRERYYAKNPVALKLEREWERVVFERFFEQLFSNGGESERASFRNFLVDVNSALSGGGAEHLPASPDVLVDALWRLRSAIVEMTNGGEGVIGTSYWSLDHEMVLIADETKLLQEPQVRRDLQLALTLLTATGDWAGQGSNLTVQWSSERGKNGRIDLPDKTYCHLHLLFTSEWVGAEGCTIEQRFDTLTIATLNTDPTEFAVQFTHSSSEQIPCETRWKFHQSWPMVRAWKVRGYAPVQGVNALDDHLKACRHVRQTGAVRKALEESWHPKDGLESLLPDNLVVLIPEEPDKREALLSSVAAGNPWPAKTPDGTDESSNSQTALQTLLVAEAGEEVVDLAEIRALPVQVLGHVHHWLVIGTRHKPTHGELEALDLLVRAITVTLGQMSNEVALATLQGVFDDDLQRYDFSHGFRIPIDRILTLFEQGVKHSLSEEEFDRGYKFAHRLYEWCVWWLREVEYVSADITLVDLLKLALQYTEHRFPSVPDAEAAVAFRTGLLDQILRKLPRRLLRLSSRGRENSQEQFNRLLMVCTDVINNAGRHSSYSNGVELSWDESRGILRITNPVVGMPEHSDLASVCAIINRCLRVPPERLTLPTKGRGLNNIIIAANRLRLGIHYELSTNSANRLCSVSMHLRRFLKPEV